MKTTSITIRLNNGEVKEGIDALRAFCTAVLDAPPLTVSDDTVIGFLDGMATLRNEDIAAWRGKWAKYKSAVVAL